MVPLLIGSYAQGFMFLVYANLYNFDSDLTSPVDPPFISFLKETFRSLEFIVTAIILFFALHLFFMVSCIGFIAEK